MADSPITVSAVRREPTAHRISPLTILRLQNGLGMREITKYCGVSPATQSRAEQGRNVEVTTALKLARFYETTVEELFGWMLDSPS